MLSTRVASGVVAVPLLLYLAQDDGWWFRLGVLAAGLVGTYEAVRMARMAGYRPSLLVALVLAIGLTLDATWLHGRLLLPSLGFAVVAGLALQLKRDSFEHALLDWALTLAMPLYAAGLVAFFGPLREVPHQGAFPLVVWSLPSTWPVLVLLTSWVCDSAAYFGGRAFGRTRLAPRISPGKTVEGAWAGLAGATVVGGLFSLLNGVDLPRMLGFGLVVGVASVVGDLAESLLKRQCGVKDSGILVPGHGGILDRMDALIFSAAAAFFYLQVVRVAG